MYNGQLLGARTFYSPYPITSGSQQLYHVNLPNINCKGYRGNGVGWICLYQNEDWSALPLNERILRFIERCSGVETYNDGNMSETDGPRFYQENSKPEYVTNPVAWQQKSEEEGFEWTLDPDLWIPVLVESMDSQGSHKPGGQPLTLADAIVGDYKAYYYDEKLTKPINAVIRPDKELSSQDILSFFVRSYNGASTAANPLLNDTFNKSAMLKADNSSSIFVSSPLMNTVDSHKEDEENEDEFYCTTCDSAQTEYGGTDQPSGDSVCNSCFDEFYVYIENADAHFNIEDDEMVYIDKISTYFHSQYDTVAHCFSCGEFHATSSNVQLDKDLVLHNVTEFDNGDCVCSSCITSYAQDRELAITDCYSGCGAKVLTASEYQNSFITSSISIPYLENNEVLTKVEQKTFCLLCASKTFICPCGLLKPKDGTDFNACTKTTLLTDAGSTINVDQACSTCVTPVTLNNDGTMSSTYESFNSSIQKVYINSNPLTHPKINKGWEFETYSEETF